MAVTKIENLIDAEVMADAISGKIASAIRVTPFAKDDTTLEGKNAGDTITVPRFAYIGDAEDVAEGVECGTVQLTADSAQATAK
jgi:N4-gp56 family major capsid protein